MAKLDAKSGAAAEQDLCQRLVEAAAPKVSSAILASWTAAGNRVTGNLRAAAAALGLS